MAETPTERERDHEERIVALEERLRETSLALERLSQTVDALWAAEDAQGS